MPECSACHGVGTERSDGGSRCAACDGWGRIVEPPDADDEMLVKACGTFSAEDLVRVARPQAAYARPCIGDRVTLNSGGPAMLVVDVGSAITVARDNGEEFSFSWPCLTLLSSAIAETREPSA